jgi:arylsulfatase A-like enzyme/cytochrome c-type biogenesis protein CcmH/NrfG
VALVITAACGGTTPPVVRDGPPADVVSVVLVTIDTLRADRVGAYGWRLARTPAIDGLAAQGARFERAYAAAPITLTSHATLLTGVDPPRHGARHNGMQVRNELPTLATVLRNGGFATAAFIAAFPLDHRFGLNRGFDVYSDGLPRASDGRLLNERPGKAVVDDALAWLSAHAQERRIFLWVHLFEPHAPYEATASMAGTGPRSVSDRYDDEIASADAQVARVIAALGPRRASTLIVLASDHGEAFGEHGEVGHSVFVYDTTLRVPLVLAGPRVRAGARIDDSVSLVDVMPTILELVGFQRPATDGQSLVKSFDLRAVGAAREQPVRERLLYAESFAPLLDFGWSSLRSVRVGEDKYIAAPKPELYDLSADAGETRNVVATKAEVARSLGAQVDRWSAAELPAGSESTANNEAAARLRSLGYLSSSGRKPPAVRADPKDRVELAARIAEITSGEVQGPRLRTALERIVRDDPSNGQMQMRLGFVMQEAGDCRGAVPHFEAAIAADVPSAEPRLGLAECLAAEDRRDAARRVLQAADRIEPGNPLVAANLGMLALDEGRTSEAIDRLRAALSLAPDLHQARFALARAYGRAGQRADAAREARQLLARLPPDAPQRPEVERLIAALQ